MTARKFLLAIGVAACLGASLRAPRAAADVRIGVSFFYDELSPYGSWVTVGRYGTCWRPARVAVGWQPYLYGEWTYTDDGWTWVSFDPWGSDTYHFGTWVWTVDDGWVWIPGTVWAPAWVTWYVSDDYCGWAPVPPSLSVGISGYAGPPVTVSRNWYVFVPTSRLAGVDVRTVRVPVARNAELAVRARPVTRFAVTSGVLTNGGPSVAAVERARGSRIERASLARAKTRALPVAAAAPRGRATVVSPAEERARLMRSVAPVTRREGGVSREWRPRPEAAHPAPPHRREKAPPRHEEPPHVAANSQRHAPPPPRHEQPPHVAANTRRHAPPPARHEEPPHIAANTQRHAPPPRRYEEAPRVAANAQRHAPSPPRGGEARVEAGRGQPPPPHHPPPNGKGDGKEHEK